VRANPLVAELGLPLDERGRVVVDEYLRVAGREDVWALGDCAAVPNLATPGRADPPPATQPPRHGPPLARPARPPRTRPGEPKAYRYRMMGQVATLGRYKGIADVIGLRLRGFPGRVVTLTYTRYHSP